MPDPALIEKIRHVMADVFSIDSHTIADDASPETLEVWDSLHNMNLIVALEEKFGVQFADDEVMSMLSLNALASAVEKHLAK